MDIADRIKQLRGNQSREQFTEGTDISPQTLYKYEKRKGKPSVDFVDKICKKLKIQYEWLVSGTGPMRSGAVATQPDQPQADADQTTCQRCAKLEKELEKERENSRKKDAVLMDFIVKIEESGKQVGDLRLENLKLAHRLETARSMCDDYALALRKRGIQDPVFDEQQSTAPNRAF